MLAEQRNLPKFVLWFTVALRSSSSLFIILRMMYLFLTYLLWRTKPCWPARQTARRPVQSGRKYSHTCQLFTRELKHWIFFKNKMICISLTIIFYKFFFSGPIISSLSVCSLVHYNIAERLLLNNNHFSYFLWTIQLHRILFVLLFIR